MLGQFKHFPFVRLVDWACGRWDLTHSIVSSNIVVHSSTVASSHMVVPNRMRVSSSMTTWSGLASGGMELQVRTDQPVTTILIRTIWAARDVVMT